MRYGVTAQATERGYHNGNPTWNKTRQIPYFEVFASSSERAKQAALEIVNPCGLRPKDRTHVGFEFSVTVVELSEE